MQIYLLDRFTLPVNLKNKSGIYKIIINKKSYIGSSKDLLSRLKEHHLDFVNNNHKNRKLLNAWNKTKTAYYQIIEYCPVNLLLEKEEHYYNLEGYYNLESPSKRVSTSSKKVYQYTIDKIFIRSWNSVSEISKELNINSGSIASACNKRTYYSKGFLWTYEEDVPEWVYRYKKPYCVHLYTLEGIFVKSFVFLTDASKYILHCNSNTIRKPKQVACLIKLAMDNKHRQVMGFRVSSSLNTKIQEYSSIHRKPIYKKSIVNDLIIENYKDSKHASLILDKNVKMIYDYIKRKTPIDNQYYLSY